MNKNDTTTVVFITGLFVSSTCWDEWISYFESKGYTCLAPPHPHKNAPAEVLRSRHPNEKVASHTLASLTDYYADIIKKLPAPPILIGHSLGGLLVQLLLQRHLGMVGIAIHAVPPKGVVSFNWAFLRATWGPLGFFTSAKKTFLMSFQQWQYAFTNGMTLQEQRKSYYQFVVPESKQVSRDALTSEAKVDFTKPHAPLLIMAGGSDRIIPPALSRANFKKYSHPTSVTDYKEFAGRNHFVLGQPTWKENADYILDWVNEGQSAFTTHNKHSVSS